MDDFVQFSHFRNYGIIVHDSNVLNVWFIYTMESLPTLSEFQPKLAGISKKNVTVLNLICFDVSAWKVCTS